MKMAVRSEWFSSLVLRTLSVSLAKFCIVQGFVTLFLISYSEKRFLPIALPPRHSMCFASAIENYVLPGIIVMTTVNASMSVVKPPRMCSFILALIISST